MNGSTATNVSSRYICSRSRSPGLITTTLTTQYSSFSRRTVRSLNNTTTKFKDESTRDYSGVKCATTETDTSTTTTTTAHKRNKYSIYRNFSFNGHDSNDYECDKKEHQPQHQTLKQRTKSKACHTGNRQGQVTYPKPRRRIVVTGIGAVTPLGSSFVETWNQLMLPSSSSCSGDGVSSNKSAFTTLEEALSRQQLPESILDIEFNLSKQLPCQIAAPAVYDRPYDPRTSRFIQLALDATRDALTDSELTEYFRINENKSNNDATSNRGEDKVTVLGSTNIDNDSIPDTVYQKRRDRCGVSIGSAMSSVRQIVHASRLMMNKGYRKISPYFVPNCLSNSASARVALQYRFRGPNQCPSTACAAGGHAIGDAYRTMMMEDNSIDVMICGGTESCIDPVSMAGFCRLNALATSFNDCPDIASRPFDTDRNGFVMAEGSTILILEDLNHAVERNAPIIYGEITGYSLSGDGYHITSPDPYYYSAQACIRQALDQHYSNISMYDNDDNRTRVGYVNAHATSTPKGDEIEAKCIQDTISNYCIPHLYDYDSTNTNNNSSNFDPVYVSSTKGSTGHLLGAAGALEAAFTINALHKQVIPHTNNLVTVDPNCSFTAASINDSNNKNSSVTLQHVVNEALHLNSKSNHGCCPSLELAFSNSFGFGGTNSCLVFKRYHPTTSDE